MKPGDRRERWKSSCETDIVIFGFIAAIMLTFQFYIFAAASILMVSLSLRSHRLGWKIDYRLPPHAKRDINKGDPSAIRVAEKVLRLASDPDRQKYAFEKGKK